MDRKIFKEEHIIFRDSLRKFLDREIVPDFEHWEKEGIVPRSAWKIMGDNGFLCPWLEEKYGGVGADFVYSAIICEEMFYRGITGLVAPLHSDIIVPYIHSYGSEEQNEPPRDCRRLHSVRGWGHENTQQVFSGSQRAGGSDGI